VSFIFSLSYAILAPNIHNTTAIDVFLSYTPFFITVFVAWIVASIREVSLGLDSLEKSKYKLKGA
jgi:hypothetical protein